MGPHLLSRSECDYPADHRLARESIWPQESADGIRRRVYGFILSLWARSEFAVTRHLSHLAGCLRRMFAAAFTIGASRSVSPGSARQGNGILGPGYRRSARYGSGAGRLVNG